MHQEDTREELAAQAAFGRWEDRPWGSPWQGNEQITAAADAITEIGLSRGMCYGTCPVYTVTLRRDGTARYMGEMFVSLPGAQEAPLDPGAFADLALAVTYLDYGSLDDGYTELVTCQPTSDSWVVRGGETKGVSNYGMAGPRTLRLIEDLIDGLAASLYWKPSTPGPRGPSEEDDMPPFVGSPPGSGRALFVDEGPGAHWTQRVRPGVLELIRARLDTRELRKLRHPTRARKLRDYLADP